MPEKARDAFFTGADLKVPSVSYPSPSFKDAAAEAARRQYLVVFIPGNPGYVEYYVPFLIALRALLNETESKTKSTFHIYSQNLIGFDDADHEPFGVRIDNRGHYHPPFSLENQVCHFASRLDRLAIIEHGPLRGRPFDSIILVGHSVGAYIAVETFHRHLQQQQQQRTTPSPSSDPSHSLPRINLRAAILLFPTVSHLPQSPSGRHAELFRTAAPFLFHRLHLIARALVALLPRRALDLLLRRGLEMPPHAADITARFLRGRDGVWQAVRLGEDELKTITEDRWGEDLWDGGYEEEEKEEDEEDEAEQEKQKAIEQVVEDRSGPKSRFFLYFGEQDHWVANEFRDAFIERRQRDVSTMKTAATSSSQGLSRNLGRTRVVVDEHKIPHAFCLSHSEMVADKVRRWIDEIAGL